MHYEERDSDFRVSPLGFARGPCPGQPARHAVMAGGRQMLLMVAFVGVRLHPAFAGFVSLLPVRIPLWNLKSGKQKYPGFPEYLCRGMFI
ncbi:MAG: hypothetical protein COT24_04210 [Candidatus Kerfeldbacteria bacterium CG08_land_8_20_14_0_20_40_16]|uniref:Uncharacterized protein n=1 Tax=Candidatus Kerfeldbacteria bacterium CG08_land_8_20_14_0_20_40_16 TaxID=2014244 RepID=A0A2H0YWW8_9BACT|nr:MAG: hypothetical protein COT24_04210 [Candidatus Kerfeldbacteria bacterium CG08_land_8_20_14_0_20_40_16]